MHALGLWWLIFMSFSGDYPKIWGTFERKSWGLQQDLGISTHTSIYKYDIAEKRITFCNLAAGYGFFDVYIYDWLYIYKVQLKLTDQLFILKYCNPVSEHHGKRWIKRPLLRPARANAKSDGNFWTTSPHTGDDDEYLVQLSISEAQVFRLN